MTIGLGVRGDEGGVEVGFLLGATADGITVGAAWGLISNLGGYYA
jgi:hypothetical protein